MISLRFLRLIFLSSCLIVFTAVAADLDSNQQQRYQHFTQTLRCLVCQNQTIADSNAPLANDLREQVKTQILAGRSDAEITTYLTDRYGDFVLYQPPFKASTAVLWLAPGALLLLALIVALSFLRRTRKLTAAAPVDAAALKQLLDEKKL